MGGTAARWVITLTLVAGVAGCTDAGTVSVAEFERESGASLPAAPAPAPPSGTAGDGALDPGRIIENTSPREQVVETGGEWPVGWGSGDAALAAVAQATRRERLVLLQVVLYPGYTIITTFDDAAGTAERITLRADRPLDAQPTRLSGIDDAARDRFDRADVAWQTIPSLVARTPGDLGLPASPVTHVIVERNLPFTADLVVRVYVSGDGGGGRIDYYADGRPMRSFRD